MNLCGDATMCSFEAGLKQIQRYLSVRNWGMETFASVICRKRIVLGIGNRQIVCFDFGFSGRRGDSKEIRYF